jgi:hypothetical protein
VLGATGMDQVKWRLQPDAPDTHSDPSAERRVAFSFRPTWTDGPAIRCWSTGSPSAFLPGESNPRRSIWKATTKM